MKYILGVDAGNTKTIALVAKTNGKIVGWGRGGCGDIYNAGSPAQALENVDDAVESAMQMAGCNAADITVAVFSMAGADWPDDFKLLEGALSERAHAARIVVVNDAVGALRAGAIHHWGVAIANGTGAAISARSLTGEIWHASWWQEGGGARTLGQRALRAVFQAELGIRPATGLTERILSFYKIATVEELLYQFSKREGEKLSNIPALARLVLDLATEGDAVACAIVCAEGANLADHALAAARKVGIAAETFPLILTGSVFKHRSSLLLDAILQRLEAMGARVSVLHSEIEPCAGALVIALEAAGIKIGGTMRGRMKSTMPPPTFFIT